MSTTHEWVMSAMHKCNISDVVHDCDVWIIDKCDRAMVDKCNA